MRGLRAKSSINEHKMDAELIKEFSKLEKNYNELVQENTKLKQELENLKNKNPE